MTHRIIFRRRLPTEFGRLPFYVSTEAGLRYMVRPSSRLDPALLRIASTYVKPGMSVWDVGANVGLFSFAAAALAGPKGSVLAFEPDRWLLRLLERSTKVNGCRADVELLSAAVSNADGLATFYIARRSRSTNFMQGFGTSQTGGTRGSVLVPTISLDTVLNHRQPPDFVKIDVEGAEALVLQGAGRVLDRRPLVFCEVAGENSEEVAFMFKRFGYRLHDADEPNIPEVGTAPAATLAIPE